MNVNEFLFYVKLLWSGDPTVVCTDEGSRVYGDEVLVVQWLK